MNEKEYFKWRLDAAFSLAGIYSREEIVKILAWFDNIKGSSERELVGEEALEGFTKFHTNGKHWNLYNSLMSRLFVYAPFILELED